jgi:hypothetical protein
LKGAAQKNSGVFDAQVGTLQTDELRFPASPTAVIPASRQTLPNGKKSYIIFQTAQQYRSSS